MGARAAQAQSSVILAVLITSRHLLISLFRNTTDSLGDRPEGSTPMGGSLQDAQAYLQKEQASWAALIRDAKITLE